MPNYRLLSSSLSIKNQVVLFLVAGITIMTLLISTITTKAVNEQSRQLMLKNAHQITEGLAKQSVFSILSGSSQNAQDALAQVAGFQSVVVARLLLEDHSVFISTGEYPKDIEVNSRQQPSDENVVQNFIETQAHWLIKMPVKVMATAQDADESEFGFSEEQVPQEQVIGYAEVAYSKESLIASQRRVAEIIASIGFVAVVLLSLLMHIGLVVLFRPLEQLSQTMQTSQKTAEHVLAPVQGAKEVRRMAHSYNSMMQVLDQQEDILKQHRDQLEAEVDVRTRELVQARDSAIIASKHKSEFMANMSHELRTPIQSIIGYGELVVEELELEGHFELIEDMDKIATNSQRLLNMINSLLDLAKIEAGKIDLHLSVINFSDLQKTLTDIVRPLANKNHNSFIIEQSGTIEDFTSDKEKLEQILINLLSNACKFTDNGDISLNIHVDNQQLVFSITDSGIGLTDEQQRYIFDEFRQADGSQSRKFSGTGLGLAISKRFVELLNGKIFVQSELGQGATFSVVLPYLKKL
ncbi:sensor histidine kinase [Thalassotalea sp. PLHSN55]|uniref:sensor histidine kinase n=1 Tax=Thalassotalea sp. PLHSN55 TaxID=3435888 RepID=UPI003F847952